MTEENTDHDLLIRLDTKLDIYAKQVDSYQQSTEQKFIDLWKAVDDMRKEVQTTKEEIQKAKGFIAGSKFIWAILGALPPSLIALFIGAN